MTDFNNDLQTNQDEVVRLRDMVTELRAELAEAKDKLLATPQLHLVKYGDEMLGATELLSKLQETSNALTKSEYTVMALRTESQELSRQLSELREKPDFTRLLDGLIQAEVEQRMERYMESAEFSRTLDKQLEYAIEEALKNIDVDAEDTVRAAVEESLNKVEIRFNSGYR